MVVIISNAPAIKSIATPKSTHLFDARGVIRFKENDKAAA
jgi:hypothetical protein